MAVRPPELGVPDGDGVGEDVFARAHRDLVDDLVAGDLVGEFDGAVGEGEHPRLDRQLDARLAVRLLDLDTFLTREARAADGHAAIDAGRHQADAPVPAGMAGGLAYEIEMDARQAVAEVVVGEGQRERMRVGPRLGDVLGDGEFEPQRIGARPDLAGDVEIVADELVLRARNLLAVEEDRGDAVDTVEGQRQIAVDIGRGRRKAAFHRPGSIVNPHHRLLIGAEIRIRKVSRSDQGGVDIAGQANGLGLDPACWTGERKRPAEVDFRIVALGRLCRCGSCHAVLPMRTDIGAGRGAGLSPPHRRCKEGETWSMLAFPLPAHAVSNTPLDT